MTSEIPTQSNIVIIGGGVIGASVAWHLTELGCEGVLILERGQLGCGTTWHSAGNIVRMSSNPNTVRLYTYGVDLLSALHERHDIGWRKCGRVMVARTERRLGEFEVIARTLQACGVAVEQISTSATEDRIPILHTGDIVGALWSPDDGRVNPTDLVAAFVREAKQRGARVCEGVTVSHALTSHGRVTGVATDRGDVRCDTVVNCAGLWARDLGLRNDVAIPLYPVEHFYVLTESIDGVYPDMPTFRDPDGLIYGREEVGGLLLGCFDRNAIPVRPSDLPEPFFFSLLNENWDQFMPYMEECIHRIPALEQAGVRTLINGPESFTPDIEPLFDEVPGLKNYFVLAGMNSAGVSRSAGMGRALANWIADGDPGIDVSAFSLGRFDRTSNDESYLSECVRHGPSGHFNEER
ncbi:MAG: FAD-binding oxidoreductase [Alphaproteobacteria bacterium]|nr:FAD-binding oxidoreductase [Alphaproteobacteria bacterium]